MIHDQRFHNPGCQFTRVTVDLKKVTCPECRHLAGIKAVDKSQWRCATESGIYKQDEVR